MCFMPRRPPRSPSDLITCHLSSRAPMRNTTKSPSTSTVHLPCFTSATTAPLVRRSVYGSGPNPGHHVVEPGIERLGRPRCPQGDVHAVGPGVDVLGNALD